MYPLLISTSAGQDSYLQILFHLSANIDVCRGIPSSFRSSTIFISCGDTLNPYRIFIVSSFWNTLVKDWLYVTLGKQVSKAYTALLYISACIVGAFIWKSNTEQITFFIKVWSAFVFNLSDSIHCRMNQLFLEFQLEPCWTTSLTALHLWTFFWPILLCKKIDPSKELKKHLTYRYVASHFVLHALDTFTRMYITEGLLCMQADADVPSMCRCRAAACPSSLIVAASAAGWALGPGRPAWPGSTHCKACI